MIAELIARLTPPCTDITRLLSESMDRTLPWRTRLTLRCHLAICRGCAEYRRQLMTLGHVFRRLPDHTGSEQTSAKLSAESRAKLVDAFRNHTRTR